MRHGYEAGLRPQRSRRSTVRDLRCDDSPAIAARGIRQREATTGRQHQPHLGASLMSAIKKVRLQARITIIEDGTDHIFDMLVLSHLAQTPILS